jgi:hypothetical protein
MGTVIATAWTARVLLLSGGGGLLVRQLRHALSGGGGGAADTAAACEPADLNENAWAPPLQQMALVVSQTWYGDGDREPEPEPERRADGAHDDDSAFGLMKEARSMVVLAQARSQRLVLVSQVPRPDVWGVWACGAAGAWLAALACSAASKHLRSPAARYQLARVDGSHARVELSATSIWNPPSAVRLPLYTSRRSRAIKAATAQASALVRLHDSSLLVVNA